jgi:hypothetical protein
MAEQEEPLPCSPVLTSSNEIQRVVAKWRNGDHTDGHDYSQFYALGLSLMGFCRCDESGPSPRAVRVYIRNENHSWR